MQHERDDDDERSDESADERYRARMLALQIAAEKLIPLLEQLIDNGEAERAVVRAGRAAHDVILEGIAAGSAKFRRELHLTTREFERAMQRTRGEAIRILVEEGPRTITEVARLTGLSPQMSRRLYRTATTGVRPST